MEMFLNHHNLSVLAVQEIIVYRPNKDYRLLRLKLWEEFSNGAKGLFTEMRSLPSY